MEKDPLISVVIAFYNEEKFIKEAIESIINQTYKNFEVIAVDDGSNDRSAEIVKSYKGVNYFYQKNSGPGNAKNLGAKKSKGEYITFLDADDYCPSDRLAVQVDYMIKNLDIDYSVGMQKFFLEDGVDFPNHLPANLREIEHLSFCYSALIIKRDALKTTGYFNENYSSKASDSEWFFKARDLGLKLGYINKLILYRRIQTKNVSLSEVQDNDIKTRLRIVKESIDRKRNKNTGM